MPKAKILDKNFEIPSSIDKGGFVFYDAKNFDVYGMKYDAVKFHRMNPDKAREISENVFEIASETAGGRVCFATDSTEIAILAEYNKTAVPYKKIGVLKIREDDFPKNTLRKIMRFKLDMSID